MAVLKELILTVSTLGGCGGLERTDFNSFFWECVAVERIDFSTLHFGRKW